MSWFWLTLGAFGGLFRAALEVMRIVRMTRPW